MKNIFALALLLLTFFAQAQHGAHHKIAIFTPLYLDSAFDASGNFRYEKTGARFVSSGLDFYYGAQMALDSLERKGEEMDVYVYDTRGRETLAQQLAKPELADAELFIAQSNAAETRLLAEAAQRRKIPFISATLPNDAGISNNPYLVVLNTTLQSHVEGIYRFLQKYHGLDRIVVFRKGGTQEDQIKSHFIDFGHSTTGSQLNIKYVDIGDNFTMQSLTPYLDSTRRTVCIAGSLDEAFGNRLTQALAGLTRTYPVRVIGMPTWDNFTFSRAGDLEVIYTNPFYYSTNTPLVNTLSTEFANHMNTRPTDLFFRGYEITLRFAQLLIDTGRDVSSSITRKGNNVLTAFDIQPVFKDKTAMTLDYFENKHLYFIKAFGGTRNIIQ